MTDYHFQGIVVDMKADNAHSSARVNATLTNANLDAGKTQISAGALVIAAAEGSVYLDVATTGSTMVLGVATQDRAVGDARPLTYTRMGLVHMIKDAASCPTGSIAVPSTQGTVKAATSHETEYAIHVGKVIEGSTATAGGEVIVVQLTLV